MPVTLTATITVCIMLTIALILDKGLVSLNDSHVVRRLFGQIEAHLPSRHRGGARACFATQRS